MNYSWHSFIQHKADILNNKRIRLIRKPLDTRQTLIANQYYLDFQTNDYLGLSKHPKIIHTTNMALKEYGIGSTGAPSLGGYTEVHHKLQQEINTWLNYDNCLIFNSGYQMNVSLFTAIADANVHIWLDQNCHASHIDGVLLSRVKFTRFAGQDIQKISEHIKLSDKLHLIISEGIYSMDGSNKYLLQLLHLKQNFSDKILLVIDDAHGIGISGENGLGILTQFNVPNNLCDILLATFGKAIGGHGGFLCANNQMIEYLQHSIRSQIYSTNLPPALAVANMTAIQIIQSSEGTLLRNKLNHNISYFKQQALKAKLHLISQQENTSPIQLIMVNEDKLDDVYNYVFNQQILVGKIKYPTVAKHQSRIRISLNAMHTESDIKNLVLQLQSALRNSI